MLSTAFMLAALVVIATPGPDMLTTAAIAARDGRKRGAAYALGVGMGACTHTLAAVVGLSALIAASPTAFSAIKWCGVVYLGYLGYQALVSRASETSDSTRPQRSGWQCFADGWVSNALNAKVLMFFLAFLPQFVDLALVSVHSVATQFAAMGLFFSLVTTLAYLGLAWAVGGMGQRARANPRFATWLNRATGLLFLALAARLAFVDTRK